MGVSSPLLAEGPGCGPLPLLAGGFRWCWWWVAPRHSRLRVLGAVPRHSWVGSAGRGGGCFRGVGWGLAGGFAVLCVLVGRRVRVVSVLVCVVCSWWWCGCGCVFFVCWCVCVCVCGVWWLVSPAGACCWCRCGCGWCVLWMVPCHSWRGSWVLLAGFRCRWWWVFFAYPG